MPHSPLCRPWFAGRLAAALLVVMVAWACGGERSASHPVAPPPPPPAKLAELWLEATYRDPVRRTADTTEVDEVHILVAMGRLTDGRTVRVDTARWSVNDTATLRMSSPTPGPSMGIKAGRVGEATISAAAAGLTASVRYTIERARVRWVELLGPGTSVLADVDTLVVRSGRAYRAVLYTRHGLATDRAAEWHSSDTTVAVVGSDGRVEARALGTTTLTARADTARRPLRLVVRPPLAARLVITYAPDSLLLRRRDSVRAVFYDSAGAAMAVRPRLAVGRPFSLNPATVLGGEVRADFVGSADLVASGDGLEVRRPIRVVPVPQAAPITYPAAIAATPGTSLLLVARAVDIDGLGIAGVAGGPTYASANPGIATVSDAGMVTAHAPGATVVRVQTGATHADVPVTVVAAGAFNIAVRPAAAEAPPVPALDAALRDAAGAWERAVVGDLPDLTFAIPPDACGVTPPGGDVTVDDVLLLADADSIDGRGGVLARAGPCIIRGDGTAVVGRVQVDSADLRELASSGRLVAVLRHEIGHVLGIGTLWSRPSLGLVARAGAGWRYHGRRALGVARWWNRSVPDADAGVPLGDANGAGSGHWNEEAFGNELMTPLLDFGANPLSLVTLEALGDLGYATSAAAAEAYGLYAGTTSAGAIAPSRAPAGAARAGAAAGAPFERLLVPRWRAAPGGRVERLAPGAVR